MGGTDPAPFGAGTSEPNVTLDTSHHAGGLRPIESMAAAQMQQLETNVVQRRPEQQPSAAAAANVFTTAQHASLLAGIRLLSLFSTQRCNVWHAKPRLGRPAPDDRLTAQIATSVLPGSAGT